MDIQALKNAMTRKLGRQALILSKNSPTIMFVGGTVGVVAAAVMASKATLRLEDILEESEETHIQIEALVHPEYTDHDAKRDHFKLQIRTASRILRLYAPSVVVGVVSVGMLTGAHVTLNRRHTAVMAAYAALDKGFGEYRDRVRAELGDEADLRYRFGSETVVETVMDENDEPKTVEKNVVPLGMPSQYARWFDEGAKEWKRDPGYNQAFIRCQQQYANNLLEARGHVFLNEIYDSLGLPRTSAGQVVGWVRGNGDDYIDFGFDSEDTWEKRMFMRHEERSILLDFNVDGIVYDLLGDEYE